MSWRSEQIRPLSLRFSRMSDTEAAESTGGATGGSPGRTNVFVSKSIAVHPDKFYGYPNDDVIDWFSSFERIARANEWNVTKQGRMISAYLRGPAADHFEKLDTRNKSNYEAIKNSLIERFSPADMRRSAYSNLAGRKQGKMESVNEFASAIQRLVFRSFPSGVDNEIIEMTAREHFILGLRHDLMRRVTMADPKTFSDAIRIALREESLEANYAPERVNAVEPQKNDQMTEVIGLLGKLLMKNEDYSKMNEEEFVEKLQLTLKSDPQPNLVPFLRRTLPHLRETMKQQTKVQTSQPLQQPQQPKMQDDLPKVAPIASQNQVQKLALSSAMNLVTNPKLTPSAIQATVMQMNSNTQRQLTPAQQQALLNRTMMMQQRGNPAMQQMQKQMAQGASERMMTNTSGGKDIATVIKANMNAAAHAQALANASAAQAAEKAKHKPAFHYSSAMTSNDDDINDVTCMAGVNLMEESAKILSTGSELLGVQTRSCKDEAFLSTEPLKRKIEAIVKKHNLREVQQDVISIVSHATEERLRNIMERLTVLSLHRVEAHKEHPSFEIVSDVKSQLRVFEQIDEVERKHREAREREMLMRVAKSRSRTEDPEQARLKEKAKQLQQEEEELLRKRAANKTALEAIGPRKKRKLDEALESLSSTYTNDSNSSADGSSGSQLQPVRLRTRRITGRDLQFVLEQDKESSKSLLLFKSFLR